MSLILKQESDCYKPLVDDLLRQGFLAFRIQDGSFGKKPYDIQCVTPNGKAMAIEVKFLRENLYSKEVPFPHLKLYAEHQLNYLSEILRRGGHGFMLEVYEKKFETQDHLKERYRANIFLYFNKEKTVYLPVWFGCDWRTIIDSIENARD